MYATKLKGTMNKKSIDNLFEGSGSKYLKDSASLSITMRLGYIAWLDDVLEIRQTPNENELGIDYDIQVIDITIEVLKMIKVKNVSNNKSSLVADYCYEWVKDGKNSCNVHDIVRT